MRILRTAPEVPTQGWKGREIKGNFFWSPLSSKKNSDKWQLFITALGIICVKRFHPFTKFWTKAIKFKGFKSIEFRKSYIYFYIFKAICWIRCQRPLVYSYTQEYEQNTETFQVSRHNLPVLLLIDKVLLLNDKQSSI